MEDAEYLWLQYDAAMLSLYIKNRAAEYEMCRIKRQTFYEWEEDHKWMRDLMKKEDELEQRKDELRTVTAALRASQDEKRNTEQELKEVVQATQQLRTYLHSLRAPAPAEPGASKPASSGHHTAAVPLKAETVPESVATAELTLSLPQGSHSLSGDSPRIGASRPDVPETDENEASSKEEGSVEPDEACIQTAQTGEE